ncbi:SDR family NAD(P)-dependent oxidoreductase [Pseudoflavitalea sp. G-6-1-2]|uniref:SDR family NAD(P)-dependent oxidoreductase n=1 Tax=Pseudoflavitalea sp. G-6-1-2 TaxID=2728841 RepID=UPI001469C77D|nr:SDR family NAD(P)-dependent oxidoreductase [Pseudoflavitalea sp. G-6-1-2]NML22693.1 SDR family NAD(P)-dependent oxidoreductase [Pseudoflavitalea sp. G-6-1-2]
MPKTVLITGATSGFGKAFAEKFAANGYRLILTGRRKERLDEIQQQLTDTHGVEVYTLHFDIQNRTATFDAIGSLPAAWQNIDVLINNAGLALGRDFVDDASLDDWETMIDTNLKGLMYATKAVLPFMIKEKKGHIINIGSTAAKEVYEKGNGYCATKHAVDAISKGMRIDLLRHGIKVTAIHPGAAETEFSVVRFKGDSNQAAKVYEGFQPLVAEDVAEVVYYTTTLPAHVCINDLVLTCTAQANSIYINK